jgi:DNA replication protein DnaC
MSKILLEKVKQDLRSLRLSDMAEALDAILEEAETGKQGYLAFLARMVSQQVEARAVRSLERRIKKACFSKHMTFETFDWNFQPALNVEYVKDLAELGFIANRQPVLILGKTGTGKTHLATAFGIRACEAGYKVEFYKLQALLNKLYATMADDTTDDFIAKLARLDLLIIDAVGYIRSKPEYPSMLLDVVSACQHRVSLIVTSNISFQEWGQAIGNPSITNAIVDRLFDRACLINIHPGRSYRTQGPHAPKLAQTKTTDPSEHP